MPAKKILITGVCGMNDDRWVDIGHARKTVGFVPQDRAAGFLE